MTEAEWTTQPDPLGMLKDLRNPRKLRLFACACTRRVWFLLKDPRNQRVVEVTEQFADGDCNRNELNVARHAALFAPVDSDLSVQFAADAANSTAVWRNGETEQQSAREAAESALRAVLRTPTSARATMTELACQAELLRDIFGNPFRPKAIEPSLLSWADSTVPRIAERIYDERRFEELPLLGDALESAGCTDTEILEHCRRPGLVHVRGCWVMDLVLKKS